ncbi:MAG TPA: hypothetical protein VLC79_10830 [Cellvibrio sp.]|nr:hypothetical protein [Cellvibrio sp.]
MKESGFFTALAKYFIFISCAVWASNTFAYLKISYDSNDLIWQSEELRFGDDDLAYYGDFFINETINFKVDITIPEFSDPGSTHLIFDDVVRNISTSTIFGAPLVTKSRFEIIPDVPLYASWRLTFDVVDNAPLANGTASGGLFTAEGGIEVTPDGFVAGGGSANFAYYWDNWIYKRQQMEWILNTDVQFVGEGKIAIEKVSVAEPFLTELFLIGMAALIFSRRPFKLKKLN